jgi:histone H3/H4
VDEHLKKLCLDPAATFDSGPWYFHDLISCLREYQATWIETRRAPTVVTEIGRLVYDTLDYAAQSKCLVLIDGLARTGKTFAAKAWCEQHPGRARYVQVQSTNDETGFFRAIAKALGINSGLGWKSIELRERIEDTLQGCDLTLVLDEAHYCWPTQDYRHALPGRINWILTALVNHGVAVALITTPQFIQTQKVVEKRTNWTSEQFIGRIGHYQKLPDSLSAADLERVARVFVPEGNERSIETLVAYAQGSAKYLAGIESIARRARYLANKASRDQVEFKDIKTAINENVIPSDAALAKALAVPDKHSRRRLATPLQTTLTVPSKPVNDRLKGGSSEENLVADLSRSGSRLAPSELAAA